MGNFNLLPSERTWRVLVATVLLWSAWTAAVQAVTVTSIPAPLSLEATNANRIVVDPNDTLHEVYVENTGTATDKPIRYVVSTDRGATWSAPVTLVSGRSPALAVDASGNLGLVYVTSSGLYYISKPSWSASWSTPVQITNSGSEPSMVGYQGNMYLAWVDGWALLHTHFSTLSPPTQIAGEFVTGAVICAAYARWSLPSIAVADGSTGQPPLVRIAVYEALASSTSCGSPSFNAGVRVYEKPVNYPQWLAVTYNDTNSSTSVPQPTTLFGANSISLTAERSSGTFYLAYSIFWNGTSRTRLARITETGSFSSPIAFLDPSSSGKAIVDVTAVDAPTSTSFKLAYTSLSSSATHDATYWVEGTWDPSSSAPVLSSPQLVTSTGRSANVIYFSRPSLGGGGDEGINVLYEESTSSGSSLEVDYFQPIFLVRSGMTWAKVSHDSYYGADHVACSGCNPYGGNTLCAKSLPILCINRDGAGNPGLSIDFYNGWIGGNIALTPPVRGDQIGSLANANSLCEQYNGPGWEMAEFHHPGGGWSWWSRGNIDDSRRFWVYINDQAANCWN